MKVDVCQPSFLSYPFPQHSRSKEGNPYKAAKRSDKAVSIQQQFRIKCAKVSAQMSSEAPKPTPPVEPPQGHLSWANLDTCRLKIKLLVAMP